MSESVSDTTFVDITPDSLRRLAWTGAESACIEAFGVSSIHDLPREKWEAAGKFICASYRSALASVEVPVQDNLSSHPGVEIQEGVQG